MTPRSASVLGVFILLAAVVHVGASRLVPGAEAKPLLVGRLQGDIIYRIDANTTGRHQVSGCKLECYDNMVAVYVDKSIATTWTTDNVLLIPWRQIDSITLMASSPDSGANHCRDQTVMTSQWAPTVRHSQRIDHGDCTDFDCVHGGCAV